MENKLEEEIKNGSGEQNSKSGIGITEGKGNKRKRNTGNKTGDTGNSGNENGKLGGQDRNSGEESGTAGQDRKGSILAELKRKRDQRNSGTSNEEHSTIEGKSTGVERSDNRITENTDSVDRVGTGRVGKSDTNERGLDVSGGSSDGDSQNSETDRGVKFELPKFSKPINVEKVVVDVKESQLEKELSKKESSELQPRIENSLRELFKGMDKVIDFTTKHQITQVNIWSSIEDDEIKIIAVALLETGQRSRVVSTITRRMARDYTKLQIGIITLPRFIQTYKHYMSNGFGLTIN
jgi:hypothetical protein